MVINAVELFLLSDVGETVGDLFAKLGSFFRELFLHLKQVPVLPHAVQQVVEEVIKVFAQIFAHKDDVVP